MNNWTMPIQQASFKGVAFDVISIEDSFEKVVMEHSYPFVNGADLEDMGLAPRDISVQALFFGEGYFIRLKKFLAMLQDNTFGVLVHPVLGRLPNMICYSTSLKHDAESVNSVQLDLRFKEATPAKPIFVFDHSVLTQIDALLQRLQDFVDDSLAWWATVMEYIAFAHYTKSTLLNQWGAMWGCVEQLGYFFELPYEGVKAISHVADEFVRDSVGVAKLLSDLISEGLNEIVAQPSLSVISQFNEVLGAVNQIQQLPKKLVTGQGLVRKAKVATRPIVSGLQFDEVAELEIIIRLASSSTLVEIATEMLENHGDTLTPNEVNHLVNHTRLKLVEVLNALRANSHLRMQRANVAQPTTGQYSATHVVSENIRDISHALTQLAMATINQKPPLTVHIAPFTGTIWQLAHHFYQDYRRANELLRLNPAIRYPHNIPMGEALNGYSK